MLRGVPPLRYDVFASFFFQYTQASASPCTVSIPCLMWVVALLLVSQGVFRPVATILACLLDLVNPLFKNLLLGLRCCYELVALAVSDLLMLFYQIIRLLSTPFLKIFSVPAVRCRQEENTSLEGFCQARIFLVTAMV